MRFHKVLFVIPKVQVSFAARLDPHLGIAYLTAILEENGCQVEIFDFSLDYQFEDLAKKINNFQPDLVGVTLFSFDFINSYKLIDRIKEQFKIPVALGGVHASSVMEKVLEQTKADYVFCREADNSLLEFCRGKPLEEISGLIYRKGAQIVKNPPVEFVNDLDRIPFPAWEKFELKKYTHPQKGMLQLATSRGCPYNCVYCAVKLSMGLKFRPRRPENVIREIEHWYNKGYNCFDVVDDTFTTNIERAKQICQLIIDSGMKIGWNANGVRADRMDEELLVKMKNAGCKIVIYGLESGNPETLIAIKKAITLEKAKKTFELTKKIGLKYSVNFIIGHPEETFERAMDSIRFAISISADYVNFFNLIPYPGTELYAWIEEREKTGRARFIMPKEEYLNKSCSRAIAPLFETDEFPYDERLKAIKIGRAVAKKTHSRYRFGKYKGNLIYLLTRNDKIYNWLRRFGSGNMIGKKIYNSVKS